MLGGRKKKKIRSNGVRVLSEHDKGRKCSEKGLFSIQNIKKPSAKDEQISGFEYIGKCLMIPHGGHGGKVVWVRT